MKGFKDQPLFNVVFRCAAAPKKHDPEVGYYDGGAHIIECPTRPELRGKHVSLRNYRAMTGAPYWVIRAKQAHYSASQQRIFIRRDDPVPELIRLVDALGPDSIAHLVAQTTSDLELALRPLAEELSRGILAQKRLFLPVPPLLRQPFAAADGHLVHEASDLVRASLISQLVDAGVRPRSSEHRARPPFHEHTTEHLKRAVALLRDAPWELVFPKPVCSELRVHTLPYEGYSRLLRQRNPPSLALKVAISIYFSVSRARMEAKQTVWEWRELRRMIPCMAAHEREALERGILGILLERGLDWCGEGSTHLTTQWDGLYARTIAKALERIDQRARLGDEPEVRGPYVPAQRVDLTPAQLAIAQHIQMHAVTVVQGAPGTGKTALLTWVVSHYRNSLCCGFVSNLVRMLRMRCGKREEIAHTMHRFIDSCKRHPGPCEAWLGQVEVLVIDELSNVSEELLSDTIRLFPKVRKLVVLGDQDQLRPIDPGDPLVALSNLYGTQRLMENLRVDPRLADLHQATGHIHDVHPERIRWNPRGPVTRIVRRSSVQDTLEGILSQIPKRTCVMDIHVLALLHNGPDGRIAVSKATENALLKLKIVTPQPSHLHVRIRENLSVYPGCKIRFTQNYNAPSKVQVRVGKKKRSIVSAPVQNNEIVMVIACTEHNTGIELLCADGRGPDAEHKTVWVSPEEGVAPEHVDSGWGTTVYSSQGREYEYVIYWIAARFGEQWTRANNYVATSRAKKRLWVVDDGRAFDIIAKRPDPVRKTALKHVLSQKQRPQPLHIHPAPILRAQQLVVMSADQPAAPLLKLPTHEESE